MKTSLTIAWCLIGLYFVVAATGKGTGVTTAIAMVCGFMVARNLADVIKA